MGAPPGTVRRGDSTLETALPLDRPGQTLTQLAEVVEGFAREWEESGYPPDFAAHLPEAASLRPLALVELIKVDLEFRWLRANLPKRLAEYREEHAELRVEPLPADLIYEEFQIRRQAGLAIDPREYLEEFPEQAERLKPLLQLQGEYRSTLIAHPGQQDALGDVDAGLSLDDFDLLLNLGRGAFARVFLARQRSMQRLVAVKVSHDHGTEPQTLAQLDHDYIVRVFDQRLIPERKLRLLYMQYLPGGTLQGVVQRVVQTAPEERSGRLLLDAVDAVLDKKGENRPTESTVRREVARLSWPECVAWLGSRLASALHYASRRGVLHRDIKPANVLLTAEGAPKLADFNISFSDSVAGATPAAYFGGSLAYMSPEQLAACHPGLETTAADLDARSDIFSLGVMLWEILTGRRPYDDEGIAGGWGTSLDGMLERRQQQVSPAALAALPADCPAALKRVLLRCLAPHPDSRWRNGDELSRQFELCLDARARELVDPTPGSWRHRLRKWTVPILVVAILGPNGLAGAYNYSHNKDRIIAQMPSAIALEQFERIQTIINGIAFPLGMVLILYFGWRVIRIPGRLRRGETFDAATLARTRRDTLRLAEWCVLVCLGEWIVAGVAYPVALHYAAGGMPADSFLHFVGSLLVCGLIATAYPFFAIACHTVRCVYPSLIPHGLDDGDDAQELARLDSRCSFYLMVAASVPLVAIAGLTVVARHGAPEEFNLVRFVCLGGIAGFALSYFLFRLLERDLRALLRVVAGGAGAGQTERV